MRVVYDTCGLMMFSINVMFTVGFRGWCKLLGTENRFGDAGVQALVAVLPQLPRLSSLNLDGTAA